MTNPAPADVRRTRKALGLTQAGAAEIKGVTRVTWARYEAGTRKITMHEWRHWLHDAGIERIPFRRAR